MKQLETQKNTIIYGGAFNPPTRAHQAILQACIDRAEEISADVWLMPSGNRTDKTIDVSREDRLRMIDAMIKDVMARTVTIDVETSELDAKIQTETYDTVTRLNLLHADRRFIWVFGSDSVATMPQWHEGEWMVGNLPMLIVERPGSPVRLLGRFASRLEVEATDASSTAVREKLAAHQCIDDLVTPSVRQLLTA